MENRTAFQFLLNPFKIDGWFLLRPGLPVVESLPLVLRPVHRLEIPASRRYFDLEDGRVFLGHVNNILHVWVGCVNLGYAHFLRMKLTIFLAREFWMCP